MENLVNALFKLLLGILLKINVSAARRKCQYGMAGNVLAVQIIHISTK